jgi:hypothetical protein
MTSRAREKKCVKARARPSTFFCGGGSHVGVNIFLRRLSMHTCQHFSAAIVNACMSTFFCGGKITCICQHFSAAAKLTRMWAVNNFLRRLFHLCVQHLLSRNFHNFLFCSSVEHFDFL